MQVIETVKVIRTLEIEVPSLGQKIKEARNKIKNEKGKTITDLASASGMSAQNWYRIENERQTLPEETLRLMEAALECSFGVSFGGAHE
ncbi:MAG: transcriptional regulator [Phormidesmis priestleyi]|uniref:Transcriptional regulator n=1 Tax=Phormidesmis priestleyi TaxID=268141 RepID=A0A2W4YU44_9CYAN|nr:MAG: transcriptional regulator [Phormidesmis priestleyi]